MNKKLSNFVFLFFILCSTGIITEVNADNNGIQIEDGEIVEQNITLNGVIYKDPLNLKYNITILKFKTTEGEILSIQEGNAVKTYEELIPYLDKPVKISAFCFVITKKDGDKITITHRFQKINEIKLNKVSAKKK